MATSSPIWTLLYGGVEKSFADWGLRELKRRQSSQSDYQVTFSGQRVPFDGTPQFAYGETVVIKKNGIRWWTGPVISIPKFGGSKTERIDYVVASPWWYLQNLTFQQEWASWNGSTYTRARCTHVFLGQTVNWGTPPDSPVTVYSGTNGAIKEILDWALYCAPGAFAYNAAELVDGSPMSVVIPIDEARDINCAEALRRVTKWLRDLVVWWDFTPAVPVLHFTRRAGLTAATLSIGSRPLESASLQPRYDLQVPSVVIRYEKTQEIDGAASLFIETRIAPLIAEGYSTNGTGNEIGAMVVTLDMKGIQATNVYGSLTAQACSPGSLNWWKLRYPWMTDANIDSITFPDGSTSWTRTQNSTVFPNELVSGSWAPWMANGSTDILCAQDTIKIKAHVRYKPDGAGNVQKECDKELSAKITVTNSAVGVVPYSANASFDGGDATPDALHRDIYNSLLTLQYSGDMVLRERECGDWLATAGAGGTPITGPTGIGLLINIAGGTGAFAAINAIVQTCDEDIDSGTTSIAVGPPEQLDVQSMVALLQITRRRQIYNNPKTQTNGVSASGGSVTYPEDNARESANSHTTDYQKLTIAKTNFGSVTFDCTGTSSAPDSPVPPRVILAKDTQKCEIDLAHLVMALPGGDVKPSVKFRKLAYCKGNVKKNIWVLCSGLYNDDGSFFGEA